ncbi:MAG: ergothioneine biosynthesis protein EgtB [Planctomycetes bacterium]|nr:ergothioneine biosynthesis protein EgtB [Planctomycetota bacterium]
MQGALREVRARTQELAASLSAEDQQVQAFPEASPTKWHLGHTTWFLDRFVLREHAPAGQVMPEAWDELFNSYYEGVGKRFERARRGCLSRPALDEVLAWRAAVTERVDALLPGAEPRARELVELGLHHEMQHQELLLTDVLANFSVHPAAPAWRATPPDAPRETLEAPRWIAFEGGLVHSGAEGDGFCFDNELPRHPVWLAPFELRDTLLTNGEALAFLESGGYDDHRPWLADGIAWVRAEGVRAPAYWREENGAWFTHTLYGLRPLDLDAPATHLSAYEADAIATWLGARLPTEHEWEHAAAPSDPATLGRWHAHGPLWPRHGERAANGLRGLWGEVWQWTRSAYLPYPGYRPAAGAVGEYNGKFMDGQWVLRGGSCATPPGHVRASYRNFFYPAQRWQFTGVRLARDPR